MKTVKLTQAKCRKWIKALRSGKYRQWRGRLHGKNQHVEGYCCLGVAEKVCDLPRASNYELNIAKIPGLEYKQSERLIIMNDKERANFNEIASYIEERILPKCPVR